jgi:hypothetical protein
MAEIERNGGLTQCDAPSTAGIVPSSRTSDQ